MWFVQINCAEQSLCRDPFVARRVRILHIHPGFLKDALDKQDASSSHRTLRDRFTDMANLIREQSIFPKNQKYKMERRCRRPEDVVQVMLEVLGGLPNVTDYFVTWCGMPTVGTVSAVGFLSTVFSANLRKLSLEISVENVHSLLSSPHDMRNLEELRLAIQRDVTCSKSRHAEILARDLAPAIGGLRKTLQTLVIQPWEPIDLSPLFLALPYLSELHTLILFVPVEGQHLGDPLGLAALLTRHAPSLRTLRLRATQNSGPGLTPNLESFHEWFTQVLSRTHLTRLRTLDVSSPLFPVETTLVAVRHFARTITSLSLTGKFWAYEDVEEVVRVVSQCNREDSLGKLCLGPTSLSPQLLELLFLNLPQLFRVELFVCGLLPHASESVLYDDGSQNIEQIVCFSLSCVVLCF